MKSNKKGLNTLCTHEGDLKDTQFKGVVSPLYMSTAYAFDDVDVKRYPRYFNTPNQEALCKKLAALEHAEAALIFGSGMAAISTALMAFFASRRPYCAPADHVWRHLSLCGNTIEQIWH
jgi:cystathionine beta-lyase